jgi:hypothetical protein
LKSDSSNYSLIDIGEVEEGLDFSEIQDIFNNVKVFLPLRRITIVDFEVNVDNLASGYMQLSTDVFFKDYVIHEAGSKEKHMFHLFLHNFL